MARLDRWGVSLRRSEMVTEVLGAGNRIGWLHISCRCLRFCTRVTHSRATVLEPLRDREWNGHRVIRICGDVSERNLDKPKAVHSFVLTIGAHVQVPDLPCWMWPL